MCLAIGVAFAAQGASQLGSFAESFSLARVALFDALQVMNRTVGSPEEVVYESNKEHHGNAIADQNINPTDGTLNGTHELVVSKILPKYEIDSSSGTGLKPTDVQGRIRFQDVVFSYPTRPRENVLKGLTTGIEPGQTVAFVGPSGSGKSTVVALLERFYDPHSGSIELDGINLKDINVAHLRSTMGYVGQEPTLFATSIRANIQYGNPDASFEDIQEAARLANAHDFIESFPDGYDTQVGDKGSQLSGGQKQRIAIARVLVKKQLRLLILDEATSALDSESKLLSRMPWTTFSRKRRLLRLSLLIACRRFAAAT
jgi:ATP-binding cassette, subfamily B (MDR/TAP), member 1